LLLGGSTLAARAQSLNYAPSGPTAFTGTYTDLGATGTVITTSSTDNVNSAAQAIGFSFAYNGSTFTQFVFNTNGVVRLGSAAPSTVLLYYDNSTYFGRTAPHALKGGFNEKRRLCKSGFYPRIPDCAH
jgi:hypothetical protein